MNITLPHERAVWPRAKSLVFISASYCIKAATVLVKELLPLEASLKKTISGNISITFLKLTENHRCITKIVLMVYICTC